MGTMGPGLARVSRSSRARSVLEASSHAGMEGGQERGGCCSPQKLSVSAAEGTAFASAPPATLRSCPLCGGLGGERG